METSILDRIKILNSGNYYVTTEERINNFTFTTNKNEPTKLTIVIGQCVVDSSGVVLQDKRQTNVVDLRGSGVYNLFSGINMYEWSGLYNHLTTKFFEAKDEMVKKADTIKDAYIVKPEIINPEIIN